MVNVAIAGGTGAVGKTLIEVMASQTKHQAVVLTRKAPSLEEKALAPTYQVDYSNVDSLKAFLEEHNIHTVISAFGINATSLATSQLNLIKAADESSVTKRFIPSSFAMRYPEDGVKILPPLEHYFTSLTFNDFVKMAEEVKGVRFDVVYDDVEKVRASQISELPGHRASYDKFPKEQLQWFLAIFELWMATGLGKVEKEGSLNEMFPEIKPLTAREMLEKYWRP